MWKFLRGRASCDARIAGVLRGICGGILRVEREVNIWRREDIFVDWKLLERCKKVRNNIAPHIGCKRSSEIRLDLRPPSPCVSQTHIPQHQCNFPSKEHGQLAIPHGQVSRTQPPTSILRFAKNWYLPQRVRSDQRRHQLGLRPVVLLHARSPSRLGLGVNNKRSMAGHAQFIRYPSMEIHFNTASSALRCGQNTATSLASRRRHSRYQGKDTTKI